MTEVDRCEQYRAEGNEHFRSSRYHNAIESYTKSLEYRETSAVLANRAQAYLNTNQHERALMDSATSLDLDATNIKAMFRYAKALANLRLYEVAVEKLSKIEQLDPNNKEVAKLKESVKGKANCAELRLSCGDRNEFLRSKVPLKEIKNIEVVRIKSEEQQPLETEKASQPSEAPLEVPLPPTTSYKFIMDFQTLRERPEAFANYFLAISKEQYGELLGEIIQTDMIETLIAGFDAIADCRNINQLLQCLIHLATVSRFDIAVMFLDVHSKGVLRGLMKRCAADEDQLSFVKTLYAL